MRVNIASTTVFGAKSVQLITPPDPSRLSSSTLTVRLVNTSLISRILVVFLARYGWTGRRDRDDSDVPAVQALRARLGRIWEAADDEEVGRRDGQCAAGGRARLAVADPSPGDAGVAPAPGLTARPAGAAHGCGVRDGVGRPDPVGELRRLKICAAPDCKAVVVDLSRNRSRMFCETRNCGNRQYVAAYRERRAKDR